MSTSVETEHGCHCPQCGRMSCTVALLDCFGDISQSSRCKNCGYVVVFEYGCGGLDDPTITANRCDGVIVINDRFIPGSVAGARSLAAVLVQEKRPVNHCWHVDGTSHQIEPVIGVPQSTENYLAAMRHARRLCARINVQRDLGEPRSVGRYLGRAD
ncbi:TPA: hypothetical protein QDB23_006615 [Burkholderia vietnamiensis]|nr:hypothetical protein [Burkholderia vietnamiensis]